MSEPLVSVILPVYNREHSLRRAIDSVLAQQFADWELIVVDDCSSDHSYDVASSYTDPRIKILRSQKNAGAATARNLGIRQSRGKFISFLDSDDVYDPAFMLESTRLLNATRMEVGVIWTGVRLKILQLGATTDVIRMWKPNRENDPYLTFLSGLSIGTNSGITVPRAVFESVGLFDETLPAAEDTDLFLRIAKVFRFDYVEKTLVTIHQTGNDRLSRRFDKIAIAYNLIIPKHLDAIGKHKHLRLKFYYKAMWLNYHLGDRTMARSYFRKVISDRLFHFNAWTIFLIFEIFGQATGANIHIGISKVTD